MHQDGLERPFKPKQSNDSDIVKSIGKTFWLAEKFRIYLGKKKISPRKLSEIIGVNKSKIYRWLNGSVVPSTVELCLISLALGMKSYTEFIDVNLLRNKYMARISVRGNAPAIETELETLVERSPSKIEMPKVLMKSFLCNFPNIMGVEVSHEEVKHPSLTEKNVDGHNCIFEVHVDRCYTKQLAERFPGMDFNKPGEIPEFALITRDPDGRFDAWGDDVYVFVEDMNIIYDWKNWAVCSIPILKYFRDDPIAKVDSVIKWFIKVSIDGADGWKQQRYNLDPKCKLELSKDEYIKIDHGSDDFDKDQINYDDLGGFGKTEDGVTFISTGDLTVEVKPDDDEDENNNNDNDESFNEEADEMGDIDFYSEVDDESGNEDLITPANERKL